MPSTSDLPRLPKRRADSHKGDYGRALLVGGSRGMSGAIILAGVAALRAGAGLVRLAVPNICLDVVASYEPSYLTLGLPCDADGRFAASARTTLESVARDATCIACGPGIGRSAELDQLVGWMYQQIPQPMVVDADALNALASQRAALSPAAGPRILTPHPGEFRRLVSADRLSAEQARKQAVALAKDHGVVIVLKGHNTLITDGERAVENTTGNPGMATGGSGDVLTGIISALVCQGLSAMDAARLGVYVHGLAGDLAAEQLGQTSLIASDLLRSLPAAFGKLATASKP